MSAKKSLSILYYSLLFFLRFVFRLVFCMPSRLFLSALALQIEKVESTLRNADCNGGFKLKMPQICVNYRKALRSRRLFSIRCLLSSTTASREGSCNPRGMCEIDAHKCMHGLLYEFVSAFTEFYRWSHDLVNNVRFITFVVVTFAEQSYTTICETPIMDLIYTSLRVQCLDVSSTHNLCRAKFVTHLR